MPLITKEVHKKAMLAFPLLDTHLEVDEHLPNEKKRQSSQERQTVFQLLKSHGK